MKKILTYVLLIICVGVFSCDIVKTSDNVDNGLTETGLQNHYYDVVSKFVEPMQHALQDSNRILYEVEKHRPLTEAESIKYSENLDKYKMLLDIQKQAINYTK